MLKIDPADGTIVKQYDMSTLTASEMQFQYSEKGTYNGNTLNGIAYDAATDLFFFSGKRYHLIFKVQLHWSNSSLNFSTD